MKLTLLPKSVIQEARGFKEGNETSFQFWGTRLFNRSVCIASSTADMLILPKMASLSYDREVTISISSLL